MNLKNVTKWIIAVGLLFVLIPFASSGGPAFQSYMEVATMVGIYISMALGLNIVVGMAGLLDLGFVAFFAVGAYSYSIFATPQAANFMPFGNYPTWWGKFLDIFNHWWNCRSHCRSSNWYSSTYGLKGIT